VDFDHGAGVVYQRYFDRDTGRLVQTILGEETFKESGEQHFYGIRFPKTIVSTVKGPKGVFTATATFTQVILNENLPDSLFAVPSTPPGK